MENLKEVQTVRVKDSIDLIRLALIITEAEAKRIFEDALTRMSSWSKNATITCGLTSLEKLLAINQVSYRRLNRTAPALAAITAAQNHALEFLHKTHNLPTTNLTEIRHLIHEERLLTFLLWTLSGRAFRSLSSLDIKSLSQFLGLRQGYLSDQKDMGKVTVAEILGVQEFAHEILVGMKQKPYWFENPRDEVFLFKLVVSALPIQTANAMGRQGVSSVERFMGLRPRDVKRWVDAGKGSVKDISKLQGHVLEILEAGYPNIDRAKLSPDNPLGHYQSLDLSEPSRSLTDWLGRLTSGMSKARQSRQAFAANKGLLGKPHLNLEDIASALDCTYEQAEQMISRVKRRALQSPYRQELFPLIYKLSTITESAGVFRLDKLVDTVLLCGSRPETLKFAAPFVWWLSTLPEWSLKGVQVDESGDLITPGGSKLIDQLVLVIWDISHEVSDEIIDTERWSALVEAVLASLGQWAQRKHPEGSPPHVSIAILDKVLERLGGRLKRETDRVLSYALWQDRFGPDRLIGLVENTLIHTNEPLHFSRVTLELKKDLDASIQDSLTERLVYRALNRSRHILLWDRGTFVHSRKVNVPQKFSGKIEKWAYRRLREGVTLVSVFGAFNKFRHECLELGVPNEIALYSLLRDWDHSLLAYPRFPYVILKSGHHENVSLPGVLEEFIREAADAVSLETLKTYALRRLFVKEYQFYQGLGELRNVLRADKESFLHMDSINFNERSFEELCARTVRLLHEADHVSVKRIFSENMPMCKEMRADTPFGLYSMLKLRADNRFDFPQFPVVRKKRGIDVQPRNLFLDAASYLKGKLEPINYSEVKELFSEKKGYDPQAVWDYLHRRSDVFKYGRGRLVYKGTLGWNDKKQQDLEEVAYWVYSDALEVGECYGRVSMLLEYTSDLPELDNGCCWTRLLARDLLKSYQRFLCLGNNTEDTFVPIFNRHGIERFSDLYKVSTKALRKVKRQRDG